MQHLSTERINLCFLLSGFCSLLYQTVWLRMAVAKFGVNAPVIASVLAVFMLGLGLGNLLGARYQAYLNTSRFLTGLRGYALLELVVSLGGLLVPTLVSYGASAIVSVPMTNGAYFAIAFLIILVALVPFCAAMGATFPVALSFFGSSDEPRNASGFSQLYFANVSGAIYGAVVPAFVAFEWLGFQKTIYIAVAANWLIALLVWNAVPAIKPSKDSDTGLRNTKSFLYRNRGVLAELFLLGACSLALEVIWARIYVFFAGAVVYSFAFILAMYLAFTALGTNFYRRRIAGRGFDVAKLWIGLAPAALLVIVSIHPALEVAPIVRILIGVAPISFLLGVVTPSLIDRCTDSEPYKVSIAYTFNLAGCIVGPLAAGFLIIPLWGNRVASYLVATVFLAMSLFHQLLEKRENPAKPRLKFALVAALSVSAIIVAVGKPLESRFADARVLYDHTSTVIASGSGMEKRLVVEGTHMTSLNVMTKMFAHVPLAFLDHEPEQGAVICFGMGTTFRSMTTWKIRTTAVELVPSVPKFFPFFFSDATQILADPNAVVLIDDGRRFLTRSTDKFDVVVADPPPPVESVSSGLLYSVEFYQIVKKRLKPNGIFGTIILSSDSQNLFSMLTALKESFRYVRLFEPYGEQNIYQVVASDSYIPDRSAEELTRRMPDASRKDLTEWVDSTPQWFPDTVQGMYQRLLDTEIDGADLLRKLEPWQRIPLTDDKPVNEYYFLRRTLLSSFQ